ncbi:MAG: hypothetical protein JXB48_24295, partial [Candidatus Latescibacteria bacterium]|nr:hypothetical protein [Candidatus Latescibacterota bacterium]
MKNFTIAKLTDLEYTIDDILEFITKLDDDFIPPLSSRVNLNDYAQKIIEKAYCIVGIENNKIIALISFYMNDTIRKKAFITY